MSGHGHVTPNQDGRKARCGGPMVCEVCALDLARKTRPAITVQADIATPAEVQAMAADLKAAERRDFGWALRHLRDSATTTIC